MARILLLMTTQTYRAKAFLQAARRLGIDVTVGAEAESVFTKLVPGATVALSFDQPDRAVEEIRTLAVEYPLSAIIGIDEATTGIAARAAAALDLPHNPVEAVFAARNKHRMRELLAAAGVPSPAFRRVALTDDPVRLAREIAYPCVVKPLALAASRGVIRADNPGQFLLAFRRAAAILRGAEDFDADPESSRSLLIEEYIPGEEIAVEAILDGGALQVLAILDKPDPLAGPFFEETIYVTPSRHPEDVQAAATACVAAAAAALGLKTGPVHAELRLNERGPWILEIAARSIGGLCSNALRFGTGLSLEEVILRQALGEDVAGLSREGGAAGAMMIPIPRAGILRRVHGREDAAAVDGIEEVALTLPLGQRVVPLPEGSQYLGFLIARGDTPGGVEAALREAHRRLEFSIEPDAEG